MSDKISITFQEVSLEDAIWRLGEEMKVPISFSDNELDQKIITASFEDKTVKEILTSIFANTYNYFEFIDNQIYIFSRDASSNIFNGYVEDSSTGERLIGASLYGYPSYVGTITNNFGFFSFQTKLSDKHLVVSYVGYKDYIISISDVNSNTNVIKLELATDLPEITIEASREQNGNNLSTINAQYSNILTRFKIGQIGAAGGERDIIRMLDQLPGATSGTDGLGGLHVRGGNADQNLIMLDGVPIYNPYHSFGLFSIFDDNTMSSVKYLKGGFPARFGGRISSVLDVRLKDGNSNKFGATFSTGLLSSKIKIEGPIMKEKLSFMVNFRRTHFDPIFNNNGIREKLLGPGNSTLGYSFGDFVSKVTYSISPSDRLFYSYYRGQDSFNKTLDDDDGLELYGFSKDIYQSLDWGNTLGVIRWNHQYGKKLFSNLTFTSSNFTFTSVNGEEILIETSDGLDTFNVVSEYKSNIRKLTTKLEFEYIPNTSHYIRVGTNVALNDFAPGITIGNVNGIDGLGPPQNVSPLETKEWNIYVEDNWNILSNLVLNYGMYSSMFYTDNTKYFSLEPRVNLDWEVLRNVTLSSSYSRTSQNLHVLTRSGSGFPTDIWVPSTEKVKPQQATLFDINMAIDIADNINFEIGVFDKRMSNVISYSEEIEQDISNSNSLLNSSNWQDNVTSGIASARGVEVMIETEWKKNTLWASYHYIKSDRQFDLINGGIEYPFKFEHRNKIHINYSYNLKNKWRFNTSWSYNSGSFTNIALNKWQYIRQDGFEDFFYYDFGEKNSFQLPAYHRLDMSINYNRKVSWGSLSFDFGIYNVYNRRNLFYITSEYLPTQEGVTYDGVSIIPILPYFTFQVSI